MKKQLYSLVTLVFLLLSCSKEIAPPKPYGVLPTAAQMEWQQMEYYMFIHFGPNTFTDVEWGNGKEDPKIFNPSNVDCRQWAATAKAAGMKGIIITAKHHDGFCLWPSKYSTHTVRESPWLDGKGDVLKDLSEACKEYDLKFGVYLSPWDQNHPTYGTDEYNGIFVKTLDEVLTGYGDVFEQWFDGANGEGHGGKKQAYDWDLFNATVLKNQPNAVIFSDVGPGCRWVGNEEGYVGETNWSRLDIEGFAPGKSPALDTLNIGNIHGQAWVPAETNVSIRPGWFYSPSSDDKVKSVEQLVGIYYSSVGRNSNLLLNVPPDRTGRIHHTDSIRLMEFRRTIDNMFSTDLAKGATIIADKTRGNADKFSSSNLLNNNYNSYWTTDDKDLQGTLTIELDGYKAVNRFLLQEYIPLGQRIKSFTAEYFDYDSGKWVQMVNETTVGYKRIVRFQRDNTNKIRITITESLACPILSRVSLYNVPESLSAPVIERDKQGMVTIKCDSNDPLIHYTIDGSDPNLSSPFYTSPFSLPKGGIVKAQAFIDNGETKSEIVKLDYDIAPTKWKIVSPVSDESAKTIDGLNTTAGTLKADIPLIVDLGEVINLKGFSYTPINATWASNIYRYNLYVSTSENNWILLKKNASFSNINNNPIKQYLLFDSPKEARYIKIEPLEVTKDANEYSVAEIGVITK